ncbi:hypothetical protein M426DRAFT_165260 [Hypoxylon sp. CI-4A]|nr:hypothetical protein M426DRAFT_165260 [Hypoxylon sp. CI-4A]
MSFNTSSANASTQQVAKRKRVSRRTRTPKIISPQAGSIYDILHDHATVSLYIAPILWTDFHAELLGCRFVSQPLENIPAPPTSPPAGNSQPSQVPPTVAYLGQSLNTLVNPTATFSERGDAMNTVIKTLYKDFLQLAPINESEIRCGGKCYFNVVRFEAAWRKAYDVNHPMSFTGSRRLWNQPVVALLDQQYLTTMRNCCFRVPLRGGKVNAPIRSLQWKRSKKIIPKNPDEDAYIFATMISMAQQHAYDSVCLGTAFAPKDVKVCVLGLDEDEQSIIVYSGIIPAALLSMFHEPEKAPRGDAGVTINYRRVPIWPILGLKERLGQALGEDIVGEFDTDHPETFQEKESSTPQGSSINDIFQDAEVTPPKARKAEKSTSTTPQKSPSRSLKRPVFSEVFNTSFSEDRGSHNFPSEVLAKRRRLEEGNE